MMRDNAARSARKTRVNAFFFAGFGEPGVDLQDLSHFAPLSVVVFAHHPSLVRGDENSLRRISAC